MGDKTKEDYVALAKAKNASHYLEPIWNLTVILTKLHDELVKTTKHKTFMKVADVRRDVLTLLDFVMDGVEPKLWIQGVLTNKHVDRDRLETILSDEELEQACLHLDEIYVMVDLEQAAPKKKKPTKKSNPKSKDKDKDKDQPKSKPKPKPKTKPSPKSKSHAEDDDTEMKSKKRERNTGDDKETKSKKRERNMSDDKETKSKKCERNTDDKETTSKKRERNTSNDKETKSKKRKSSEKKEKEPDKKRKTKKEKEDKSEKKSELQIKNKTKPNTTKEQSQETRTPNGVRILDCEMLDAQDNKLLENKESIPQLEPEPASEHGHVADLSSGVDSLLIVIAEKYVSAMNQCFPVGQNPLQSDVKKVKEFYSEMKDVIRNEVGYCVVPEEWLRGSDHKVICASVYVIARPLYKRYKAITARRESLSSSSK